MTITRKVKRGDLYLGEDKTLRFHVDLQQGDDMTAWELEFVVRDFVTTCRDPRDDPGTGTLRLTVDGAAIAVNQAEATISVTLVGDDVVAAGLQAADYYAALNRIDSGNTRPLAILAPCHFSPWPQGD